MEDQKNEYEQVVKALECHRNNEEEDTCKYCKECPAGTWELAEEELTCIQSVYVRAVAIIKLQKDEIADLQDALKCEKETNAHLNGEYLSLMKVCESQKAEIERLSAIIWKLKQENLLPVHSMIKNARLEVARDIFADIENLFAVEKFRLICNRQDFASLKKKYTEDQHDG